jgi:hypothetical protein
MLQLNKINQNKKQEMLLNFIKQRPDSSNLITSKIQLELGKRLKRSWNKMYKASLKQTKMKKFFDKLVGKEISQQLQEKKWRELVNYFVIAELSSKHLPTKESFCHMIITGDSQIWEDNEPPTVEELSDFYEFLYGMRDSFVPSFIELDENLAILETEEDFFEDEELLEKLEDDSLLSTYTDDIYNYERITILEKNWKFFGKHKGNIEYFTDAYGIKHFCLFPFWKYNRINNFIEKAPYEILSEKYEKVLAMLNLQATEKARERVCKINAATASEKVTLEDLNMYRDYHYEKEMYKKKFQDYVGILFGIFVFYFIYFHTTQLDRIKEIIISNIIEIKIGLVKVFFLAVPSKVLTNKHSINDYTENLTYESPWIQTWIEAQSRLELPFARGIEFAYDFLIAEGVLKDEYVMKVVEIAKYLLEIY